MKEVKVRTLVINDVDFVEMVEDYFAKYGITDYTTERCYVKTNGGGRLHSIEFTAPVLTEIVS